MKDICFVNFSDGPYINHRNNHQKPFLEKYSDVADIVYFTKFSEIGSPSHNQNPYFFKPLSILKAKEMGYKIVIYLDSPFTIKNHLDLYIQDIKNNGVYLSIDSWSIGQWANDNCLEHFNVSREEMLKISNIQAGLIAFDFNTSTANEFLNMWIDCGKRGLFIGKWHNRDKTESKDIRCLGHRHDQTCAELVAYKLGVKPLVSVLVKYVESWKKI